MAPIRSYWCRQQGVKASGGDLNSCKLRMRVKFNILVQTNYIPLVSCISNLFTSWHCLLKSRSILHGYLLGTYRCGIRILSAMVWSQGGADYTASPFPRAQLLQLWYRVLRISSVPVTHEGYLLESRRPLWFGSSQANRCLCY